MRRTENHATKYKKAQARQDRVIRKYKEKLRLK